MRDIRFPSSVTVVLLIWSAPFSESVTIREERWKHNSERILNIFSCPKEERRREGNRTRSGCKQLHGSGKGKRVVSRVRSSFTERGGSIGQSVGRTPSAESHRRFNRGTTAFDELEDRRRRFRPSRAIRIGAAESSPTDRDE